MKLFTSTRERRFWYATVVTTGTIYATLGVTRPLLAALRENGLLEPLFVGGMLLVVLAPDMSYNTHLRKP